MQLSLKKINLFFLAYTILWTPIQLSVYGEANSYLTFFLTLFVFALNVRYDSHFIRTYLLQQPYLFWCIWILYSIINLYIKDYEGEFVNLAYYFVNRLFLPFFAMTLANKEIRRDQFTTLRVFTVVFTLYAILSVTVLGEVSDSSRFIGELGNSGPITTMFLVFFAGLLFVEHRISIYNFVPIVVLTFFVVASAGTRKAFFGLIMIFITLILSQLKFNSKNLLFAAMLCIALFSGYKYSMEYTTLGERFKKGIEEGMSRNTTSFKVLTYLGDRATFYITGWSLFVENPITGVGLGNYRREAGSSLVIHSEYMVQLAEGGLIGTVLFLLFIFKIGRRISWAYAYFRHKRSTVILLIGGFSAILFVSLTAWTYTSPNYFIVYGVILGCVDKMVNQ